MSPDADADADGVGPSVASGTGSSSTASGGGGTPAGDLPPLELAFPGPLRDLLVAAVLSGAKTATTDLLEAFERAGEPLPRVGDRWRVVDSQERTVAVVETTGVRVVPLDGVDLAHARDEGEGHPSVAAWREAHERFWTGNDMRAELGDPPVAVGDRTPVVLERFRVVEQW